MKLHNFSCIIIAIGACLAFNRAVVADSPTIYNPPPFDYDNRNGNQFDSGRFSLNGAVYGTMTKWSNGSGVGPRAVRWDKTGAVVEYQHLGGGSSTINAIDGAGTAVGYSYKFVSGVDGGLRAARWNSAGIITELSGLGSSPSGASEDAANAINASGRVAGYSTKWSDGVNRGPRAVLWDGGGGLTELGGLGTDADGWGRSEADDINDSAVVAGTAYQFIGGVLKGPRAVRWNAGSTTPIVLGTLNTDTTGSVQSNDIATKINNAGIIIGASNKMTNGFDRGARPVRWGPAGTAITELGNLGTDANGFATGVAADINEAGSIVGWLDKYVNGVFKGNRAVRWNAGGTAVSELATLSTSGDGVSQALAFDINESGLIAGSATTINFQSHAVVWRPDGTLIDLNGFVAANSSWVRLEIARSIDDNNYVVGQGIFDPDGFGPKSSYYSDFLFQIPEPSVVMSIASVALALHTRMRKRRRER